MPGKSRRKVSRSKRRTSRHIASAVAAQRQAVAQTDKPVSQPKVPPAVIAPTPKATITTARYPYLVAELRRIAILAGVVLAILVILAVLLP